MQAPTPPIVFVAGKRLELWTDAESLDAAALDAAQERFRNGVDVWVVQTYLRIHRLLAERGVQARLARGLAPGAICIAHRDDLNRYRDSAVAAYVVGIRADRPPLEVASKEIVQNDLLPDTQYRHYLPLWSQPGLVARDRSRGSRIRTLAYFGRDGSAPPWYADPSFRAALARRGLHFEVRVDRWNDYRDVDVLLAHRIEAPTMLAAKPASKLINAWCAGTPALLGPEPAFRRLRASEADFIETQTGEEVLAAVDALMADPARYEAMVTNGARRAAEFSFERIGARWVDFLVDEVVPAHREWLSRPSNPVVSMCRYAWALSVQKLRAKVFRARMARELSQLRSRR